MISKEEIDQIKQYVAEKRGYADWAQQSMVEHDSAQEEEIELGIMEHEASFIIDFLNKHFQPVGKPNKTEIEAFMNANGMTKDSLGFDEDYGAVSILIIKAIEHFQPVESKDPIDLKAIRNEFFKEHTRGTAIKKVDTAPHDLFEWFKRKLEHCQLAEKPATNLEKHEGTAFFGGDKEPNNVLVPISRDALKALNNAIKKAGKSERTIKESVMSVEDADILINRIPHHYSEKEKLRILANWVSKEYSQQKTVKQIVTEEDIIDAENKAYILAGHNAYFSTGFRSGFKFGSGKIAPKQSEWISVEERMPNKNHVKQRTQFILKGYYEYEGSKGGVCYEISRLMENVPESHKGLFESPRSFVITGWKGIDLTKN